MALTAREWLLLPENDQKKREKELSPHECFLLRTELAYVHFSEEEKKNMTREEKEKFLHVLQYTEEELAAKRKKHNDVFEEMLQKTK